MTTTSYAILGLLSIKPWSAYELAEQMNRSLRYHWPRAKSRIYLEAPNLVAHGLATASEARTGARRKTVYSITRRGRAALRRWLTEPSAPPQLEAEAFLRSLFAECGTKEDLLRTLRQLDEQAGEARDQILAQGVDYLTTGGPFPARLHLIALNGRLNLAFTELLRDWARWAIEEVSTWPSPRMLTAADDPVAVFRRIVGEDFVEEIERVAVGHLKTVDPADLQKAAKRAKA